MGVFLFGVWNFGRAAALNQQMALLQELSIQPDPRFLLTMALVWGFLFMGLFITLWQKRPFTRKLIPLLLTAYALYDLGLTGLFAQTDPSRQAIWLKLGFYLAVILISLWALNRTAVHSYFNKD